MEATPIDPEVLPTLFEPFRHGEARHDGLGLYIVREIVRAQRRSVGVSSTPAEGTMFTGPRRRLSCDCGLRGAPGAFHDILQAG
jgi:light-regulated signal transduction histidine kinase (bacteriophytochrome)